MFLFKHPYLVFIILILLFVGCSKTPKKSQKPRCEALLATKFNSMDEFTEIVNLKYINKSNDSCSGTVQIQYKNQGQTISSQLSEGVTQGDIVSAHKGSIWNKISLVLQAPYAIIKRKELSQIFMLARRRPAIFGENDVAFYDLAQASMQNIIVNKNAFKSYRDSLEKGYINTFNHITAQALITAIYNEEIAHYIASVHERHHMPQLVSGKFTEFQLNDTINFPVDNYVDIINNEIGQELGNFLKYKYTINQETIWTADFTCKFLNEVQDYYAQSFDIEIKPYQKSDSLIKRFSQKIETVKNIKSYI